MRLPIRIRLALVYCAVFFSLIAVLETMAYHGIRTAVHSIVDHELETRIAGIDDHLSRHIDKQPWSQLHDSLAEHAAFQPDFLFFQRVGGEVLFEGRAMRGSPITRFARIPMLETMEGPEGALRVLSTQRTIQGRPYNLALGTDLLVPSAVLRQFWLVLIVSLPLVLLIASAAGYWIAGRALLPITGIIAATRSINSRKLSERIAVPDTGDEIRVLAETINGMLKRIEDGFRQIQQFTENASHELRTPAAIIRASAEVALLKTPAEERVYRDALHRILRESERNSTLIESLLQLARSDSGTEPIESELVDLASSVSQSCAQLAALAESKQLRLRVRTLPCVIHATEEHLHRLWLILIENAIRYTPSGGNISVAIARRDDGRPCCAVSDSGIGIAAEHLPRIFERFYRVDKARSRADGGTGLGLAIASELAALCSASIEVQSEPGQGTTFRVTFPLQLEVNAESNPGASFEDRFLRQS